MAAKDKIHDVVKNALIKDGWEITDDPLEVEYEGVKLKIDLGAEQEFLVAAVKQERQIAVEIKGFLTTSPVYELHRVVGQFLDYEQALEETHPGRVLYLAVPLDIYRIFFATRYAQAVIRRRNIRIIVISTQKEEIVEWKN
jgi:hypothetical protein